MPTLEVYDAIHARIVALEALALLIVNQSGLNVSELAESLEAVAQRPDQTNVDHLDQETAALDDRLSEALVKLAGRMRSANEQLAPS